MRLAALLRRQIAEGTLAPGMPTPSITTLSQEYGHARQTCAKALRVLEEIGTSEARMILESLAGGCPDARLTQDAKTSLVRLKRRSSAP